eukprot:604602-Prymnesium_polylepis.1
MGRESARRSTVRRGSARGSALMSSRQPVQFQLRILGEDDQVAFGYAMELSLAVLPLRACVPLPLLHTILQWVDGFLPPLLSSVDYLISSLPPGEPAPELVADPPGLPPIKFQFVVESLVVVVPSPQSKRAFLIRLGDVALTSSFTSQLDDPLVGDVVGNDARISANCAPSPTLP